MKQRITHKLALSSAFASFIIIISPSLAFAHVVVTPDTALTGAYETFSTSVPNEKDVPVTGLRLVIPNSVDSVTPTVKSGWDIQTKKSGDTVTEITWTGGSIPPTLRDVFTFSAHMPAEVTDIHWKAYQTYQDGSVVSWDQKPTNDEREDEAKGPYSTTTVNETNDKANVAQDSSSNTVLYILSTASLVLSVVALMRTTRTSK